MADGVDAPAHLRAAVVFQTDSLEEIRGRIARRGQSNHVWAISPGGVRATMSAVDLEAGQLTYGEVHGVLANAACTSGDEISVGVVAHGRVYVNINGEGRELGAGDSVVYLPGDEAVHVLSSSGTFALRLQVLDERLLRIRARRSRDLRAIRRWPAGPDSLDLARLLLFLSNECDRHACRDITRNPQLRCVAQALVERAGVLLGTMLGDSSPVSPEMLHVCLSCDAELRNADDRRLPAAELARAACTSVRQLYRAFDEVTGVTPLEYQTRTRLRRVRAAIIGAADASGSDSVSPCLPSRFGFGSFWRFTRAYAAEFGETPSETAGHRTALVRRILVELAPAR